MAVFLRRQVTSQISRNLTPIIFLVLFFVGVYLRVLLFPAILGGIDFQIPFQSLETYWRRASQIWSDNGLGYASYPDFFFYNILITGVFLFLSLGNTLLAQKIFISGPLFASVAMYVFCQKHLTRSRSASIAGALVYAYNPFNTQNFGTGLIWANALAPLVLHYGYNLLEGRNRLRNIALFSTTFSIAISFGIHSLVYIPIIMFTQGLIFAVIRGREWRHILKSGLEILLIIAILVVINPGLFNAALVASGTTSPYPAYGIPKVSIDEYYNNYAATTTLGFFSIANWLKYSFLPPLGVVLPLLAFSALILPAQSPKIRALAPSALVISSYGFVLMIQNKSVVFLWLYQNFPPLSILRGTEGITPLVAFSLASLWAIALSHVIPRLFKSNSRSHLRILKHRLGPGIVVFLLVLLLMVYNPVFTLASQKQSQHYPSAPGLTPFPSIYYDISHMLASTPSDPYRYIMAPMPHTSVLYLPYENPSVVTPFQGPELSDAYVKVLNGMILSNTTDHWGQFLALANVRYVIVPTRSTEPDFLAGEITGEPRTGNGQRLVGDPQQFIQLLSSQLDLRIINNTHDYAIYENMAYLPRLSVHGSSTYVIGGVESFSQLSQLPGFDADESSLYLANSDPSNDDVYFAGHSDVIAIINPTATDIQNQLGICGRVDCSAKQLVYLFGARHFHENQGTDFSLYQINETIVASVTNNDLAPTSAIVLNLFNDATNLLTFQTPKIPGGGTWYIELEARSTTLGGTLYLADSVGRRVSDAITVLPATFNSYYAKFQLYIPSSDNYSIAFKTVNPFFARNIALWVDNSRVLHNVVTKDVWNYIQGINLAYGYHNVTLETPLYDVSDVVFYKGSEFQPISQPRVEFQTSFRMLSPNHYTMNITTNQPVFITLSESYSDRFHAVSNGVRLRHFAASSWANGFYLNDTGTHYVVISYEDPWPQYATILALVSFITTMAVGLLPRAFYSLFRNKFARLARQPMQQKSLDSNSRPKTVQHSPESNMTE